MKLTLLLSLLALSLYGQAPGQLELRFLGSGGMQSIWVTPVNGKVLGFSGTTPVMLDAGGGLEIGATAITGATNGYSLVVASGVLSQNSTTGTGNSVLATDPVITLTNATGLPVASGISGLGTGVATALAVNVGSAGAPVVNGGALGTPSSGTGTNITNIPPANVIGTAAILGSNVFTGVQTLPSSGTQSATVLNFGTAGTGIYGGTNSISFSINNAARWSIDNGGTLQGGSNNFQTAGNMLCQYYFARGGWYSLGVSDDLTLQWRAAAHLGLGSASATPITQTIGGAQGSGTNITGGTLNLGTRGTGTGTGGVINFQSHAAGASSSTLGTLATIASVSSTGLTIGVAGAASASPLALTGAIYTGGTTTTTKPQFLVEPTGATSNNWSLSGTAIGANAASGFTGDLLNAQVNGSKRASINYLGYLTLGASGVSNTQGIAINGSDRSGTLELSAFGNGLAATSSFEIKGNLAALRFVDNTVSVRYGYLSGIASGHVGWQANSGPMKVSISGNADPANYERLSLITAAGDCELATEAAGTGTRRNLVINAPLVKIGLGSTGISKVLSAVATKDFDLTAVTLEDQTMSVTGAEVGDTVELGVPNGSVTATASFTAWVSAPDIVKIRCKTQVAGENPASGSFRATVTKY